jgi:hypothetical protein
MIPILCYKQKESKILITTPILKQAPHCKLTRFFRQCDEQSTLNLSQTVNSHKSCGWKIDIKRSTIILSYHRTV